jgi:hypothetical protein
MPIMLNSILAQSGIELSHTILVRHKDPKADKGQTPFDMWLSNRPLFENYQAHQGIRNRSKFSRARNWVSFVGTPDRKTMSVGLYASKEKVVPNRDRLQPHSSGVDKAGTYVEYSLVRNREFDEFDGKLFIDWGQGPRSWVQRADNKDKRMTELRVEFREEMFPGFLNFVQPLSKIASLPQSWINILRSFKGIYLLTCPRTNEHYVGSATGKDGFWQRWLNYAGNRHGGNIGLRNRVPSDYQISILEVVGSDRSEADILKLEQLWIRKLQSRDMGLNRGARRIRI